MFTTLRRGLTGLALALLVAIPASLALLAIETSPRVADPGPPDARSVHETRDLARDLQELVASGAASGELSLRQDGINSALASLKRLVPGIAGRASVADGALALDLSLGAPVLPEGLWANLHLTLAASEHGLRVTSARVGRLPLPPQAVLGGLRMALDRALGDGLGPVALAGVSSLRIDPPEVTLAFSYDPDDREALFARFRDRAREFAGAGSTDRVWVHLWYLDRVDEDTDLPPGGSVLPFFRHIVAKSAALSKGEDRDELKAAFMALMLYCGDASLGPALGVRLNERRRGPENICNGTTLAGRDDLKRHFSVSAGIYAGSTGSAAAGMGELKELFDSRSGGSGFSFDDMAANAAGIRFAREFLDAPKSDWPAMLALVTREADILPALDGLPSGLSEAEFTQQYGNIDSPEYAAALAEINRRIDALPLYNRARTDG
jgi:hypothetical protein